MEAGAKQTKNAADVMRQIGGTDLEVKEKIVKWNTYGERESYKNTGRNIGRWGEVDSETYLWWIQQW